LGNITILWNNYEEEKRITKTATQGRSTEIFASNKP
jgi:hypothetical protein